MKMLMLVCFRCIQVFTYEEGHRCPPSAEDINDTENVLLIDYEPVNFRHNFTTSNKKACIQTSGGDFNPYSASISVGMNNKYLNCLPSTKQSRNLASGESLSRNNSASSSEPSSNIYKTTYNKCQQNDKVLGSPYLNDSLLRGNSSRDCYQDTVEKENMPSASQDVSSFTSHSLDNDICPTSALNHLPESEFIKESMLTNSPVHNNTSRDLEYLLSQQSTIGSYLDHFERAIASPQLPDDSSKQTSSALELLPESEFLKESMLTNSPVKCNSTPRYLQYLRTNQSTIRSSLDHCQSPQLPAHTSKQTTKNECIKNDSTSHAHDSEHSAIPTIKKGFTCKKCSRWFRIESAFNAHVQNNCDPNPYNCDKCPEKFPVESSLIRHHLVHTEEIQFKCEQCPYSTRWKSHLNTHNQIFHGK